jgi:hypothetical protein
MWGGLTVPEKSITRLLRVLVPRLTLRLSPQSFEWSSSVSSISKLRVKTNLLRVVGRGVGMPNWNKPITRDSVVAVKSHSPLPRRVAAIWNLAGSILPQSTHYSHLHLPPDSAVAACPIICTWINQLRHQIRLHIDLRGVHLRSSLTRMGFSLCNRGCMQHRRSNQSPPRRILHLSSKISQQAVDI